MLLDLTAFPIDVQQKISHVTQGESIDLVKNGKVFASIVPKNANVTVFDMLMAGDYPDEVADIEWEEMPCQTPNLKRFADFD